MLWRNQARGRGPRSGVACKRVTPGSGRIDDAWKGSAVNEGGRLIVIGGDAAGMSAASQLRRMRPDVEILAFERGPHTSYAACGIPYYIGGLIERERSLIARSPEGFARMQIDARVGHEVEEIDLAARRVRVRRREDGRALHEPFDELVIATGTTPIWPALPGIEAEGIHSLALLADALRLQEEIETERPRQAVIVGGGYIGLEMAEAFLMRGLEVALVEAAPTVMTTLDPDMSARVIPVLEEAGVTLYLGEVAQGFEVRDGRVAAVVTDQRTIPADIVVMAVGVRPNTALAEGAGVPLGATGAIAVNARMQTGVEGVWAAGDCAESFHLISQRPVHIALGTIANKQGRICGINLAGGYARFPGVVGSAITKFNELEIARTGLNEREAQAAGFEYVVGKIDSRTRAGYYPGAEKLTVKVLADRATGRLLGAQIVGGPESGKRIDIFATALHAGMTVDTFMYLDLSYAPPFSPVWDPVLIAARKAAQQL